MPTRIIVAMMLIVANMSAIPLWGKKYPFDRRATDYVPCGMDLRHFCCQPRCPCGESQLSIRRLDCDRPFGCDGLPVVCCTHEPLDRQTARAVLQKQASNRMAKNTFRVVTRGANGELRIRDYPSKESLLKLHTQIGIDDCSTDLSLRGLPVFRGLIGPMPDGKGVIRYESPEVFETLTKEWSSAKTARRSRRRTAKPGETVQPEAAAAQSQSRA